MQVTDVRFFVMNFYKVNTVGLVSYSNQNNGMPGMGMQPMGMPGMGMQPMGMQPMGMQPMGMQPMQGMNMQQPMQGMYYPQVSACTMNSAKGKLSFLGKRFTKINSSNWDEVAFSSIKLAQNGMTYNFKFNVHHVGSDKSGLVFGFNNELTTDLNTINTKVVGLSADGINYK